MSQRLLNTSRIVAVVFKEKTSVVDDEIDAATERNLKKRKINDGTHGTVAVDERSIEDRWGSVEEYGSNDG